MMTRCRLSMAWLLTFLIAATPSACLPSWSRPQHASEELESQADTVPPAFVHTGDSAAALAVVRELWRAHLAADSVSVRRASFGEQPLAHLSRSWPVRDAAKQPPERLLLVWLARFAPESDTVRAYIALPMNACVGSTRRAAIGFLLRPSLDWRVERVMPLTEC